MGLMSKNTSQISSLAAPTREDLKLLEAMTRDERMALICAEIEAGRADFEAGRYIELATDDDIHNFFEASRAKYETTVI